MKTLSLVLLLLISTLNSNADEMRIAVCCIRFAVHSHPEMSDLKHSMKGPYSRKSNQMLRKKEAILRMRAREIIKDIAAAKGYVFVFESTQTRREIMAKIWENNPLMLIDFSGDDISEEVASILAKTKTEVAAGQPATRALSK